jgi:hypothetical protein
MVRDPELLGMLLSVPSMEASHTLHVTVPHVLTAHQHHLNVPSTGSTHSITGSLLL